MEMARPSSDTHTATERAAGTPRRPRSGRLLGAALVCLVAIVAALAPTAAMADRPPVLSLNGETLTWTASGRHDTYRLMTRVIGGERHISTVEGLTATPPAVPGATVVYRVKAAFHESKWSNRVSISYGGETPPPEEEEPPLEEEESSNQEGAGVIKYAPNAASYFDPFASEAYLPWLRSHVSLMLGYAPFADIYVRFGLPVVSYHDPATEGYSPLTASSIASYVSEVKRDANVGYLGQFIDDVNLSPEFRDGTQSTALEPEKHELALLVEAVRKAQPNGVLQVNSQFYDIWPLLKANDPDAERIVRTIDLMTKEFGVGPDSGIDTPAEYAEFFNYVEYLHARGVDMVMGTPDNSSVSDWEYNLATYLLFNDGDDYIGGKEQTPVNFWPGYEADLGDALGPRERSSSGLWIRHFSRGVVYTVEPGAGKQTINLGTQMHSAQWGNVETITLKERQGAVLEG